MIYLKLRQAGEHVNHKRVDRLYAAEHLQIRPAPTQEGPGGGLAASSAYRRRHDVWSADFVFDRTAEGRPLTCLTIVDDATKEAVAIVPARALGGLPVTRVLDRVAVGTGTAVCPAHRQRAGVLWACHADVGTRARRHASAHRAGQGQSERLCRIVQWPLP